MNEMRTYDVWVYYSADTHRHYWTWTVGGDKPTLAVKECLTAHFQVMAHSPDDAVCHVMMERPEEIPLD
jgi:hypothetical protein